MASPFDLRALAQRRLQVLHANSSEHDRRESCLAISFYLMTSSSVTDSQGTLRKASLRETYEKL